MRVFFFVEKVDFCGGMSEIKKYLCFDEGGWAQGGDENWDSLFFFPIQIQHYIS